jgi:hypothetical protein
MLRDNLCKRMRYFIHFNLFKLFIACNIAEHRFEYECQNTSFHTSTTIEHFLASADDFLAIKASNQTFLDYQVRVFAQVKFDL